MRYIFRTVINQKRKKGFIALLGIVMALLVILFLYYKIYYKPQDKINQTEGVLTGKNLSDYKTIIDTSKEKIEIINKQSKQRNKQIDDLF